MGSKYTKENTNKLIETTVFYKKIRLLVDKLLF